MHMRMMFGYQKVLLLAMGVFMISCETNSIVDDDHNDDPAGAKNINLSINIPKRSASTYAGVDGTIDENHIDTLYVNLFQGGVFKELRKFYDSSLEVAGGSNDSVVRIAFETESLSGDGTVTAEVYANRMAVVPITKEISLPDRTKPDSCFMMSGSGTLTYSGGSYNGVIHVIRNVAKLRVRVSRHPSIIPSDLIILYSDIKIEAQQIPDRTQLMMPPPIATPSGLTYINYSPRTGATLRPESPIGTFTGGQIDSMYLNENYLNDAAYTNTNKTQIKVTLPTQVPTMPVKTEEYTYQLFTEGSYRLKRNYIYTLDIRVAGQTLEPFVSIDIQPWNDVPVDGDINGVSLYLDKFEVNMLPVNTKDDPAVVGYRTDNTSVTLDWSKIDPAHNIDMSVSDIQGMTGEIKLSWTGDGAPDYDFKDTLYVTSQNIVKAVVLDYKVPKGVFGDWIGTFHRWNQKGERIIKMRNRGEWTATVTQGSDFIVLDGAATSDANWGTASAALGNDTGFDANYPVNSTATSVSGNGIVYFRVGMKSTLAYIGAPPRYGVIKVTTDDGIKTIYVRQGEEADYIMRPADTNPSDGNRSRSYAMKFSPYNLSDPQRGTGGNNVTMHTDMLYGEVVFDNNKFTDYPSQGGYFFQWNLGGETIHKAFHPVNTVSAIAGWDNTSNGAWRRAIEPCPPGYRHPNDSLQSPVTSEIRQSWYAIPNSDTYGPAHPSDIALDNSVWGFYADGFFDRLAVVSSPNGVDSTTVSFNSSNLGDTRNSGIAYAGRLIYNPVTNASLFLPASGLREGNSNGILTGSGAGGTYWTNTYNGTYGWAFYFTPSSFYSYQEAFRGNGASVRCVKDDFGLPGSM